MYFKIFKQKKPIMDYNEFLVSSDAIEASHKRCRDKGLNPKLTKMPQVVSDLSVKNLLEDSKFLLLVTKPVIEEDLYLNFTNKNQLIILCNHEGYVIALLSSLKVLDLCSCINISLGTSFQEEICGTNAIALTIQYNKMVVIKGEQHYCKFFKHWSCVEAPIRSPNGDVVGYLDVSIDSEEKLGHTLALVQLAVKYIEKNIKRSCLMKLWKKKFFYRRWYIH